MCCSYDLDFGHEPHRASNPAPPLRRVVPRRLASLPGLRPCGLHAYDGHLHQADHERACGLEACDAAMGAGRNRCARELRELGCDCFGTRRRRNATTFPLHRWTLGSAVEPRHLPIVGRRLRSNAARPRFSLGSRATFPRDQQARRGFASAPSTLGFRSKAVAADPKGLRVVWPDFPEAEVVVHSEEHLTLRTSRACELSVGDVFYGIPWHICPTCALHARAIVVIEGRATTSWPIDARERK